MKIIFLHYAGGNSYYYLKWKAYLPNVKMISLDLPGHGVESNQPLLYDFQEGIENLHQKIVNCTQDQEPYIIFGHSMGGIFINYILELLENNKNRMPDGVILSGTASPAIFRKQKPVSQMSDEEFLTVTNLNGNTKELMREEEFSTYFMPILRADFTILDSRSKVAIPKKSFVKASVFNGIEDYNVIKDEKRWDDCFTSKVSYYHFKGGHFYFENQEQHVCNCIMEFIEKELRAV